MFHTRLFLVRLPLVLLLLGSLTVVTGCGKKAGSVTGTVTYKDKPLTTGTITFLAGKDAASAPIGSDGKYTATNVPIGNAKVTISVPVPIEVPGAGSRMMDASKMGGKESGKAKVGDTGTPTVKIPNKYARADTTTLTFEVKSGSSTFDVKLTD